VRPDNARLLVEIDGLEGEKTRIDDGIASGFSPTSFGEERADDDQLRDLRTRSSQYQEQILNLQSKLQCGSKGCVCAVTAQHLGRVHRKTGVQNWGQVALFRAGFDFLVAGSAL
jgi:hypothetical protein